MAHVVLAENTHPLKDQPVSQNNSLGCSSKERISDGFRPFDTPCTCADATNQAASMHLIHQELTDKAILSRIHYRPPHLFDRNRVRVYDKGVVSPVPQTRGPNKDSTILR
jgi:hypothetical protein